MTPFSLLFYMSFIRV